MFAVHLADSVYVVVDFNSLSTVILVGCSSVQIILRIDSVDNRFYYFFRRWIRRRFTSKRLSCSALSIRSESQEHCRVENAPFGSVLVEQMVIVLMGLGFLAWNQLWTNENLWKSPLIDERVCLSSSDWRRSEINVVYDYLRAILGNRILF